MKGYARHLLIWPIVFAASGWLGFKAWLQLQPEDFRQQVNELSTSDFWRHIWQQAFPTMKPDIASWQRRDYPGRGRSPWVFRTSLDGQPRMLNLSIAPDYWLSYSLERMSPYQLWKGDLRLDGPVFDGGQGGEPYSSGIAYLRQLHTDQWWMRKTNAEWQPAQPKFLSYSLIDDGAELHLNYRLISDVGEAQIQEMPQVNLSSDAPVFSRRLTLVEKSQGVDVRIVGSQLAGTDGQVLSEGKSHDIPIRLDRVPAPIVAATDNAEPGSKGGQAIEQSDCLSCHSEHERIVGPSWSDIAQRFKNGRRSRADLIGKIIYGGRGEWGETPMPAHLDLSETQAAEMLKHILSFTGNEGALPADVLELRKQFSHTYDAIPVNKPAGLHPAMSVQSLLTNGFTPAVGGMALDNTGSLYIATWDRDGAVYRIQDWATGQPSVARVAEGLHEPLGLAIVDQRLFVMQKQELTELIDTNTDGFFDTYKNLSDAWEATPNFHEFGFGLVSHEGYLYGGLSVCVELGGKSCKLQVADRGSIFRVDSRSGKLEILAKGLRTPNGIGVSTEGQIWVTDNQGDWLPASKLVNVVGGEHFGFGGAERVKAPALWLPQNEIGNSPTQPLVLGRGPYKGQLLFGDIYNGGIKRAYLEKVAGEWQGAAFHFSDGLAAPVNRLMETEEGLLAGQIGSSGNWGEADKPWFGLQLLRWSENTAFEPLTVNATPHGFKATFSKPLHGEVTAEAIVSDVSQWFYYPSPLYGGPKYGLESLAADNIRLSQDRRTVEFDTPLRKTNHVIYIRFNPELRSQDGETLWVNEAWYTLNNLPATEQEHSSTAPDNTLSQAERDEGWQLLFDGKTFTGWRNHLSDAGEAVTGWEIDNGTLKMVRDTSFLKFVINILNPFTDRPLRDLMTVEQFKSFELSLEWKISEGGNSGIFYLLPPSDKRLPWDNGLEMQVLDNQRHGDGKLAKRRAGELYDLAGRDVDATRPVGKWNHARIRVQGDHIQHWLNGTKMVDIQRSGDDWQRRLAESKFSGNAQHGQAVQGHILLQDHGDVVWYKNIKIKQLPGDD